MRQNYTIGAKNVEIITFLVLIMLKKTPSFINNSFRVCAFEL